MTTLVVIPYKYREYVEEELSLVNTVYSDVEDVVFVKRPNRRYYVSMNTLEKLRERSVDNIVIMDIVKPRHVVNLYQETRSNIVDRVQLILEIFALHAGSREAKLQIELARLRHELPLIREMVRRAKLRELPGFLGPGEYAIDKYYRYAKTREARIRRELEKIRRIRMHRRAKRLSHGLPHVALVGYTCAGKTSLFNRITGVGKPVGPEPFTTLSPKVSAVTYNGVKIAFIDTVGFIRDLPVEVIEAFYATLEEAVHADVIVNVVDISRGVDKAEYEIIESMRILGEIGVHGKPVVTVLNKIDLIPNGGLERIVSELRGRIELEYVVPLSAKTGENLDLFMETIRGILA